jgi:flagellar hook protein FlgE
MSLFSALTVAVGGLSAQSSAIGNISENLANTQTVGYKRGDTSFEAQITATNSAVNNPGGVLSTPKYANSIQGSLVQDQSSTSLAISGSGYFAVRAPSTTSTGTTSFSAETFYTRRGDYTLDKNGYMVNGAGYYLTGYNVNPTTLQADTSSANPIQISQLLDSPVSTTQLTYSANLPASAATGATYPASTINIYDALGNTQQVALTWTKNANTSEWNLNVACPSASPAINQNVTFTFNSTGSNAGTIKTYPAGITLPNGSLMTVVAPSAPDYQANVSIPLTFAGAGSQTVTMKFGGYDQSSGVTQYADSTVQVSSLQQNGIPRGSFKDLAIDKEGYVTINYDNGRSRTLYQVPIVQFFNEDKLQRANGGAFQQTVDSGTPRYSAAGTVGAGSIVGNSLEASNVDIADEFTKMIQAQRVYSANAKTITTTNSMLDEVINIVR